MIPPERLSGIEAIINVLKRFHEALASTLSVNRFNAVGWVKLPCRSVA